MSTPEFISPENGIDPSFIRRHEAVFLREDVEEGGQSRLALLVRTVSEEKRRELSAVLNRAVVLECLDQHPNLSELFEEAVHSASDEIGADETAKEDAGLTANTDKGGEMASPFRIVPSWVQRIGKAIEKWWIGLMEKRVKELVMKAGIEEGTEAFDLAVRLGMAANRQGFYWRDNDGPVQLLEACLPIIMKEARIPDELSSFLRLGIQLAEKGINPISTLRFGIPHIKSAAKTPEELDQFLQLGMKLAETGISPSNEHGTGIYAGGITSIASAAKTPDDLKRSVRFGMRLAEEGIDPYLPYCADVMRLATSPGELDGALTFLENWIIDLRRAQLDLECIISATADVSETVGELQTSLACIGDIAIKMKNEIGSLGTLRASIPEILRVSKTPILSEEDLLAKATTVRESLLEKIKSIPPTITEWEAHPTWPGPAEPYPIDEGWVEVTKTNPEYKKIEDDIEKLTQLTSALSPGT